MSEDFATKMAALAEAIVKRASGCRSEEQTKQSLIQPVIHVLGYDIFDPSEVVMEYACDAPVLKTRSGKPESVDYAIRIVNRIAILIEAKDVAENLDRHGGQLARYFMSTECRHAVLTNGIEWRFFSDLDRNNVMDENPYRIIDMRSLSTDDIEFLAGFRKEGFSEEGLRSEAERAMYASKISDYIKKNIIDDMADDIVRIIVGHVYNGVRSAAVLARFKPMISEEFDKCISDKYAVRSSLVKKTGEYVTDVSPSADSEAPQPTSGLQFPIEVFYSARDKSFEARALYLGGNRITLLAGSTVARQERSYLMKTAKEIRRKYTDENYVITKDITLSSASTAGAVVNGRTCDAGRLWRVADGRSILEVLGGETWNEASRLMPSSENSPSPAISSDESPVDGGHAACEEQQELGQDDSPMLSLGELTSIVADEHEDDITWPVHMSYVSANRDYGIFSATARIFENGSVIVEAGSVVSAMMTDAVSKIVKRKRHEELDGLEADEQGSILLPHDVQLDSASTAACFVCGTSVSGNYAWRDDQGRKLGDLK